MFNHIQHPKEKEVKAFKLLVIVRQMLPFEGRNACSTN